MPQNRLGIPRHKSVHRRCGDKAESSQANPMSKVKGLINAHLCPVLISFVVIDAAIQIAPIAGTSTSALKPLGK